LSPNIPVLSPKIVSKFSCLYIYQVVSLFMDFNIVEYLISNWSLTLSIVIISAIGRIVVIMLWDVMMHPPHKYIDYELQEQGYSEGDVVIFKRNANKFIDNEVKDVSSSMLWIVVSFEDGLYILQNYQFNGCMKPATNTHITIFKRSE